MRYRDPTDDEIVDAILEGYIEQEPRWWGVWYIILGKLEWIVLVLFIASLSYVFYAEASDVVEQQHSPYPQGVEIFQVGDRQCVMVNRRAIDCD